MKDAYIKMLEKLVKEQSKTVAFYADKAKVNAMINGTSDDFEESKCGTFHGGKRARECRNKCAQIRARFEEGGKA